MTNATKQGINPKETITLKSQRWLKMHTETSFTKKIQSGIVIKRGSN